MEWINCLERTPGHHSDILFLENGTERRGFYSVKNRKYYDAESERWVPAESVKLWKLQPPEE